MARRYEESRTLSENYCDERRLRILLLALWFLFCSIVMVAHRIERAWPLRTRGQAPHARSNASMSGVTTSLGPDSLSLGQRACGNKPDSKANLSAL